MVSEAKNVTDYLKEVPEKRKKTLQQMRKLFKEILIGYEDIHDVMLSNKELLKGLNHGKGCIRYSNPDKIDFEIIKKLLIATVDQKASPVEDICL